MIICVLKRILQKKKSIFMQLLKSPIPLLTAAALWMIICTRPALHFDNHEKGMTNFETLHSQIRCVLSVKESNFNEKKRSKFSHLLTVRAQEADPSPPPLTVSLTVKCPFFCLMVVFDFLQNLSFHFNSLKNFMSSAILT